MSNVKSLKEVQIQPVEFVIDELRQCLELAKQGKLRGVAVTGVMAAEEGTDGSYFRNGWCGEWGILDVANALTQHSFMCRMEVYKGAMPSDDVEVPDDDDDSEED